MESDLFGTLGIQEVGSDLPYLPVKVLRRYLSRVHFSGERIEPSGRFGHCFGGRIDGQSAGPAVEMDAPVSVDIFFELGKTLPDSWQSAQEPDEGWIFGHGGSHIS